MLRSFIAVEIPAEIRDLLGRAVGPVQTALPKPLVRWVSPQNIHLTLKFLGDVSPANLGRLAEALQAEAINHEVFTVTLGGLGAFPNPRQARTIWIGLSAPPGLQTLARSVEAITSKMGYPPEGRPFSPHLTIGRVGQNVSGSDLPRIRTALEGAVIGSLGIFRVDAVHIFKSVLQPGGSVYTRLYRLPLKAGQR